MKLTTPVSGFSKFSKMEKIKFLSENLLNQKDAELIESFWHSNNQIQKTIDEFSENTITNFPLPFGVVPNVIINNELFCVPMVIEESSVVAACANSAKFWSTRGGFKTTIIGTQKVGHVHLKTKIDKNELKQFFQDQKELIYNSLTSLTENMDKRGGGLRSIELIDRTADLENYFQLEVRVETCDAMGANFINSILEQTGKYFGELLTKSSLKNKETYEVIMAILSNYTPDCLVRSEVTCSLDELNDPSLGMSGRQFAEKFKAAVDIARVDTSRATTHNKGIFNGVDAVILATGNDFRAVEACGHTYACRDGKYRGLSYCKIEDDRFHFWIDLPLAVGTVGGLTKLHPLSRLALDILGRPNASKLMEIIVTTGLAQNFGALRSLVTTGIQKGHMKMHLMNILNQLNATEEEVELSKGFFSDKTVSFRDVRDYLIGLRR